MKINKSIESRRRAGDRLSVATGKGSWVKIIPLAFLSVTMK